MNFHYRAKDSAGNPRVDQLEAASLAEARQKLRKQGLFLMEIAEVRGSAPAPAGSPARRGGGRLTRTDVLQLMSQLTIMNQSGVDLAESLKNAADQSPKAAMKRVLEQVHADVSAGKSFSWALEQHPAVFDAPFVAGVAAAERSGTMAAVFERLTYLLRSDIRLRSTVWSMLMYPLVLGFVTFGVLNAMVFFVLPQFAKVFSDLGTSPPPLTALLLGIGQFARDNILLLGGAIGASVAALVALRNHASVRRAWDWTLLNGLLIKDAVRALSTGRVFRLLGTMLQSGVPLVDGIRLCRNASKNQFFRGMFDRMESDVLEGRGLASALAGAQFVPLGAASMVATAERSGKLGQVLQSVGEYYEDEGEQRLRDLIKILEPAIILILGTVVAGVVLSIVLPLLDVTSMSH
jgi:type II secretory pathway component PulF